MEEYELEREDKDKFDQWIMKRQHVRDILINTLRPMDLKPQEAFEAMAYTLSSFIVANIDDFNEIFDILTDFSVATQKMASEHISKKGLA